MGYGTNNIFFCYKNSTLAVPPVVPVVVQPCELGSICNGARLFLGM